MIGPGDVVVCVSRFAMPSEGADTPRVGSYYRVTNVIPDLWGEVGLWLSGMNHEPFSGFNAKRFRKIRPADPQFISLIKSKKREDA